MPKPKQEEGKVAERRTTRSKTKGGRDRNNREPEVKKKKRTKHSAQQKQDGDDREETGSCIGDMMNSPSQPRTFWVPLECIIEKRKQLLLHDSQFWRLKMIR